MTAIEKVWFARHASVAVCDLLGSVTANLSTGLYPQVSGGSNVQVMTDMAENVSIDHAEMAVEVINTLGASQKVNEKRPAMVSGTMDIVYSNITKALIQRLTGLPITGGSAPTQTWVEGDKPITANHRLKCALSFRVTDGTYFDDVLLNNCYITKISDCGIAGDDYHKAKIEFSALAQDTYSQDNLSDS